ncbi:MAG TPA: ABC transporter ATP-binding protein [Crocinitomicaceae bacterium]|nr:ABC transporter ATP-binding protein [Crocinitomicaceae bacterium]
MGTVIEIKTISKTYKGSLEKSLNHVSFSINQGDKIGIFGPNGAGKTTLISIICGIINASSGEVKYRSNGDAVDLKSMLYKIGYVPQDFSFYEELSPFQNLMYFGSLYAIPKKELKAKIDNLLNVLGLAHVTHKKVVKFSGGMKRRVNLAIGIINDPDLLFLDEPTVGVDVQSKNAIIAYLEELNKKGTTIIYTSHHMNEAQEFCNRIVLIDKGNLIESNTLDALLEKHNEQNLESLFLKLTGIEYRD